MGWCSPMKLIGETWRELWRVNRGGGLLTLAFWYTLITSLYQYLVASRLGPSLPKSLIQMVANPGAQAVMPHLSAALWLKLALVYLTFLIIIIPFGVGGLYGGIAWALKENPRYTGFLAFFRFGYQNFWRALEQILLAILCGLVAFGVITALIAALSAFSPSPSVLSAVAVFVAFGVMLWMIGTLLYWFVRTFATQDSPARGFKPAFKWSVTHLGSLYANIFPLMGLIFAAVLVTLFLARVIPVLGAVLLVLVLGMVAPAFMGVYALELYQQFSNP